MQATKHTSKGIHPGFETQGRSHQKFKTGVPGAHKKDLTVSHVILDVFCLRVGYDGSRN